MLKKQSNFSRLMDYAGTYRYFTYASWVLSALSALVALVPFLYIWMILRDVLNAAPDYARAVNIPHDGWMAVAFAVLCSHLATPAGLLVFVAFSKQSARARFLTPVQGRAVPESERFKACFSAKRIYLHMKIPHTR